MFLFGIAAETVGERNRQIACRFEHPHIEPLSPVIDVCIGHRGIQQVVPAYLQLHLFIRRGPFHARVEFPNVAERHQPLQGRGDIHSVQFEADVGLRGDAEGVVQDGCPHESSAIDGDVVIRVAFLFQIAARERQVGVPDLSRREREDERQGDILLIIEVDKLIDERQLFRTLIGQLDEIILRVAIREVRDVLPPPYVGEIRCIFGRWPQIRIAHNLRIAVQIADRILQRPVIGVCLVRRESELENMLRTLLITELKGRIHRPFPIIHQLITFPRHRERHREFLAERLLHAGIKIIRFLLNMRIDRIIRRFSIQSMIGLPALLVGEGEVEAVIQSPPAAEGVFLSGIDLPAVDFLPIVHAETLRRSVRIRPAIVLHRRALIIGIVESDVQSEARRVVCRDVVHLIFGGFEVFRLRNSSPRAV